MICIVHYKSFLGVQLRGLNTCFKIGLLQSKVGSHSTRITPLPCRDSGRDCELPLGRKDENVIYRKEGPLTLNVGFSKIMAVHGVCTL